MNEKAKSPSGHSGNSGLAPSSGSTTATAGCSSGNGNVTQSGNGPPPPPPSALASNNNNDAQVPVPPSPYGPQGIENMMPHYHMHPQQPHPQHLPLQSQNPNEPSNKEGGEFGQSSLSAPTNTTGVQQHPVYGRYHHGDPNVDPYRYGHSSIQQPPPGSKAQQSASGGMGSPNRQPQQRYIPGQPPQGPTPTLNSLLQSSHPPPTQHRYTNNYDPQQTPSPSQQQHGASQQQVGIVSVPPQTTHAGPAPPPHHQHPYAAAQQGGWAPPPRPYSPQLGPSQQYRTPPPPNTSRCPSPYSQPQSQTSGPFQNPPQQQQPGQPPQSQQQSSSVGASGVPPVTQSTSQGATTSNYLPYPQRYPTPPGSGTVSNHRTSYATHQYTEQNRPWTGASSPGPSPAPSNHPLPPASPHHSQHAGPTPSSSPGHAPSPSPQPSQASPSPHQELVGQNSNDSLSGAGGHGVLGSGQPGTPNSQPVMRPTPSPTGSSGSRSMSPAVAQNHSISRPSSNQSSSGTMQQQPGGTAPLSSQQPQSSQQQSQNSNSSASNSPQQGNQQGTGSLQVSQQPPPPNQNLSGTPPQAVGQGYGLPPHMHGSYKMSGQSPGPGIPPAYPPSTQQTQQYSQGSYTPRQYPPSNYGTNPQQPNQSQSTSNMNSTAGSSQYPNVGRPVANHGSPGQYPPYQSWVGPPPGPGGPASTPGTQTIGNHVQGKGSSPQGSAIGSPRPLNYLKQHLQHKSSYPGPNGPPIGYGNGPAGMPPGMSMGPPHHMGPPPHGAHTNMGPPPNTPPQSMASSVVEGNVGLPPDHIPQDNGLSSGSSGPTSGGPTHPVTSVVTTGPDGTTMDDVSQQSTLSNASAASSDDPQCTTPKSRKNDPYVQSHLAAPSTSPGVAAAGSTHSGHPGEDYEINSPPNWARTPASPSYNSHVPPAEVFRSTPTPGTPVSATASAKKSDSLCKLYEMDDNPERRGWLDKLRAFMDERRTPITACPTISKQPLDLYRLYLYVKERGGFVEVCKVTKSKTWKDIAGLLGIGASSSAAYTLRKHYTKNLLAFECHFDRGDIDPLPIIQQVEAGTKKKSTKAASVPSPAGSSNSQDSFPAPAGTNNTPMDGYPPYAATYSGSGGPQQDYGAAGQLSRPPSQSNSQNLHPGSQYTAQPGSYNQYPSNDQYSGTGPSNQFSQQQGQFPPQNRNIYPPYGPEGESAPSASNQYGPYSSRTYGQPPPVTSQSSTPPGAPPAAGPQSIPTGPGGSPYPSGQQEYYRPPEQGPRRHPDFVKDSQQYPGYNARPQMYGWPNASNQYRSQYQSAPSAQGWGAAPPRTTGSPGGPLGPPQQAPPTATSQWDQHRYPPQQQPPPPQQQQQQQQQQQPPQQPQQAPFPPQQQNLQQPPSQWPQMGPGVAGSTIPGAPGSPLRSTNAGQQQQQQRMPNIGTGQIAPGPQTVQTGGLQPNNSASVNLSGKQTFSMPPPSQANSVSGSTQPGSATLMPSVISGISQKPLSACNSAGSSQLGIPPQSQHQPIGAVPQLAKKEIVFPPDSIEATTPILYRRKRLAKGDVCPIDPWRIFMAMRSGQLTECTWALDVLNVLLFDDSTVQHFGLAHLPGLLTLLLEHFQKNLAEMFADEKAEDVKTMLKISRKSRRSSDAMKHVKDSRTTLQQNATEEENRLENDSDSESYTDEGIDLGQIKETPDANERVVLLAYSPNYTMMSRKGLPVRLQNAKQDLFITDELKSWDTESTRNYEEISTVGCNSWTYGFIEPDLNGSIIDVFKTEIINIPFARYIKMENNFKTNDNADKSNAAYDNFSIKQEQDVIDELNNKNITHLENIPIKSESTFDEELVARIQQNTFNKKRRLFNNLTLSDGNAGDLFHLDPIEAKKSKTHNVSSFELNKNNSSSENSGAATNTDSDCREVDMDLETISSTKEPCRQTGVSECFDPRSTIRDPAFILQRRRSSSLEDECYTRDESSLYLVTESQDSLARRCICISNIFRNLSFVPGNESVLAKSPRFLAVLGRLLLLNHEHLPRTPKNRNYDRGTEDDTDFSDSCSSLQGEKEWWWDYLICIRENMLVIIANIAGHLDLSRYEELIARPIIDGLLHWAVCPSAHGQDPFPSSGPISALSPQRLALEALCKLCVTDNNVDLVIATPPHSRLEKLCAVLTRHLCRNEDQVLREFSVNLLHYLAAADSAMARTVALQSPCISYLVAFIEQAEQTALGVANQHGINYLRENPDSMGTSLDMLRRTAGTLLHLAKHPDNRSLFMQQEQRLLGLVMSHILDQQVALIISRVLFQVSRGPGTNVNSLEYRLQQKQLQQKMGASENNKDKEKLSLAKSIAMSTRRIDKEILYQTNDIKLEQIKDNSLLITDTGSAGCGVENFNNIMNTSTSVTKSTDQCNTKPSSASSTMVSFGDSESSDSSSQITHSVAFNDISNSSTNSSSCGTVVSNHSTLSQSSNSNVTLCATIGSTGNISSTNMHVHTSSGSYQSDHPKININSTAPTSQNNSNTGSIQMINTNSTELSSIPNASASSASTAPTSPASVPPSQTSTVTTSTAAVA